jgi:hypothetical protein
VRDRGVAHRHVEHITLGPVLAFPYRVGNGVGLPETYPDPPVAVADDHHGAEVEAPAALDDLGDPTDLDHPVLKV